MSPEVPSDSCISSHPEALALDHHVFCTKVKGHWKWSKMSLVDLVLTCICGGLYPQFSICAFLKQICHIVILVSKCVSSVMKRITSSELLACIFFWQVLKAHPNYPKIRKEILDKARASLRNWIFFCMTDELLLLRLWKLWIKYCSARDHGSKKILWIWRI